MQYTDTRDNHKPPVVFVHGLGQDHTSWQYQRELSPYFRMITVKVTGYKGITVKKIAEAIIALMGRLKIARAHFCGLSLGGIIIQEIERRKPLLVRSMILANTLSYVPLFTVETIMSRHMHMIAEYGVASFKRSMMNRLCYSKDEAIRQNIYNHLHIIPCEYKHLGLSGKGFNNMLRLPMINKPVLMISGDQDKVTPLPNQVVMAGWMFRSRHHIIKNCGHLSNLEHSDEFNDVCYRFLKTSCC